MRNRFGTATAFPNANVGCVVTLTASNPVIRRYKANAQRAARDGDYKYLKILDNTFLFNVVDDPMERANLKVRQKDIYDRLVAEWHGWNATMLAEIDESNTGGISGDEWADHIGTQKASGKADNPDPPKTSSAKAR
jgi:hypothetical protein